jgi:hypothetical protein
MNVIFCIHGGCFVGGNSSWDKEQNLAFINAGFYIHQPDFDKSSFQNTINDLTKQAIKLKSQITIKKYIVLGRSSGGLLAKHIFDLNIGFDYAIYLAPVMNPYQRMIKRPKFKSKQLLFFGTDDNMKLSTKSSITDNELLLCAENDDNVPFITLSSELQSKAIFLGAKTHIGLITTTSKQFIDTIVRFVY